MKMLMRMVVVPGLVFLLAILQVFCDSVIEKCVRRGVSLLCNNTHLHEIPQGRAEKNIQILEFSENKLMKVSNESFAYFPHVQELYLSYNEIQMLDVDAFTNVPELVRIDLSGNFIKNFHQDVFHTNKHLVFVSLRGNPLVKMRSDRPLLSSSSIETIDLGYCSLSSLSERSFSELPSLSVIDLTKNDLQSLSVGSLDLLPKLSLVDLQDNRWLCNCNLGLLLKWVSLRRPSHMAPHDPVYCIGSHKEHRLWSEDDEARCEPRKRITTTATTPIKLKQSPAKQDPTAKSEENEMNQGEIVSLTIVFLLLVVSVLLSSLFIRYFTKKNSLLYASSKFGPDYSDKTCEPIYEEIEIKRNYV